MRQRHLRSFLRQATKVVVTSVPPSLLCQHFSKTAGSSPATRSGNNRECDAHTSTLLSLVTIKEMS